MRLRLAAVLVDSTHTGSAYVPVRMVIAADRVGSPRAARDSQVGMDGRQTVGQSERMDRAGALLAVVAVAVFIWAALDGYTFGMLIPVLILAGVGLRAARRRRSAQPGAEGG